MSEAKDTKKKTVEVSKVFVDPATMTLSANVKITGEIKSEDKWSIADASTVVRLVKVPLNDLIVRVVRDWFWVRKIQDVLRKGNISDARTALNAGYDWNETLARTRVVMVRTPESILEGVLADADMSAEMSEDERKAIERVIALARKKREAAKEKAAA